MTERLLDQPDGVPGVAPVRRAISLEDEVGLQVARVVVSRVEVGDDPRRDAEATQDCRDTKGFSTTVLTSNTSYSDLCSSFMFLAFHKTDSWLRPL